MKKTSHILFLVNNYPPKTGGVESHVENLAKTLVNLGYRCSVITLSRESSNTLEDGIRVIRVAHGLKFGHVISFPKIFDLFKIEQMITNLKPTVISTHTRFFPLTWLGVFWGRRHGIPVLHTEHGSGFVRGLGHFQTAASRIVDLTLGTYSLRKSTKILAVSNNVATFVENLSNQKSDLFLNAVFLENVENDKDSEESKVSENKFVFVGRLVPGKGADLLLRAAAILRHQGVLFSIEILGEGEEEKNLVSLSKKLGLSEITHFKGRVSHKEVMDSLKGSVYVNPTVLSEGFQTTLLEAIVANAQIVTFEAPGVDLLISQKAPVRVVSEKSIDSLAVEMKKAILHPMSNLPQENLIFWSWPFRAQQYIEKVELIRRDQ